MIEQNVPVLLVGLGGIGGSIVNKVMEKIPKEQRDHVGAVAIDTDLGDLNKLEEVQKIWMGNDGIVKNLLVRYPEYLEWFPANKFINTRGLGEGAGQIRAIARLVMAASVRSEYVLAAVGDVQLRSAPNDKMKTGKIEIAVEDLRIISESEGSKPRKTIISREEYVQMMSEGLLSGNGDS